MAATATIKTGFLPPYLLKSLRIRSSNNDASARIAAALGTHEHHFHVTKDANPFLPDDVVEYHCCTCPVVLRIVGGDPDRTCSALMHHLHIEDPVAKSKRFNVRCCVCDYELVVHQKEETVNSKLLGEFVNSAVKINQAQGNGGAQALAALTVAFNTLRIFVSNALQGKRTPIPVDGKKYRARLGYVPQVEQIFRQLGFELTDGKIVPPDLENDPAAHERMASGLTDIIFSQENTASMVSQFQGTPGATEDETDATGLISAALGANYTKVKQTKMQRLLCVSAQRHFDTIGAVYDMPDEYLIWGYQCAMREQPELGLPFLNALRAVAVARESPALTAQYDILQKEFLKDYRGRLEAEVADKEARLALRVLGATTETPSDMMPTLYEIHVQDAPAKRLVYEQAIRAIARARASKGSPTAAAAAVGGVVDPLTALVATFDPANDGRYALEELGGAVALCELGPDDSLGSGGGASSSMAAAAAAGRASSSARAAGSPSSDAELQRAIAASLEDVTGGAHEDDESRPPVAASRSAFGAVSVSSARRVPGLPSGLSNIGNTCYFNSLLQAFFHLPPFRRLILARPRPPTTSDASVFLRRLQRLFAYMTAGEHYEYSPRGVVNALRDSRGNRIVVGFQQDITEYMTLFLDALDAATKGAAGSESRSGDQRPRTPIEALFFGEMAQMVDASASKADFNQVIVLVAGQRNLYNSLDAYTADTEVEFRRDDGAADDAAEEGGEGGGDGGGDGPATPAVDAATKTTAFETLPPVLTFHLQRVAYNVETKMQSKVHDRFEFPSVLYMDRYLARNAAAVQPRRETERALKAQRSALADALDHLNTYTPAASAEALMAGTLAFLNDAVAAGATGLGDDVTASLKANLEVALAGVRAHMQSLQDQIADIDRQIDALYDDLQESRYLLYGIMVHQGMAGSGHYWAYLRDFGSARWVKYNDSHVGVAADEDQVMADAFGGGSAQTSAYCVMYVDAETATEFATPFVEDAALIPPELQERIATHNAELPEPVAPDQQGDGL